VSKPEIKVKTVQDRREEVRNRRVRNRQEKYHHLGLEESPMVMSKECINDLPNCKQSPTMNAMNATASIPQKARS
jgi:hypothetical protein